MATFDNTTSSGDPTAASSSDNSGASTADPWATAGYNYGDQSTSAFGGGTSNQATPAGLIANYGGPGGSQPGNTGAGPPPVGGYGGLPPMPNWGSLLSAFQPDPAWAHQSQQYLDWYTGTEYPQQYALQQQLQGAQIGLAQNQNDMQNALATAGLTGQYGGDPTLQAQSLMAQYGLAGSDQALAARGQNVGFAQGLEGLATNTGAQDVQMAGIQAQLAQSPLVAWYTARGLPPPQSAIMNAQAPNLDAELASLGMTGGMQSFGGFTPYQQDWRFSGQGPPVQSLTPTPTANLVAMPTNLQDMYNQGFTLASQVKAAGSPWNEQSYEGVLKQQGMPKAIADEMWQQAQAFGGPQSFNPNSKSKVMDESTWAGALTNDINAYNQAQQYGGGFPGGTVGGGGWDGGMMGSNVARAFTPGMASNIAQAGPGTAPAVNPAMSQGAPPWATTMAGGGQANPMFVGGMQGMPSTQEWASANPMERQAMMSVAQSVNGFDPNTFYQQLAAQSPNFGGTAAPLSYQSYG